ncbi:geminin-like isoform X1 [Mizuhopecten yessoensis]|uniref:geminin-like isoform X1 n=1 Tax=Mizuhopecten yessoensis TaxID=6573 RepID=UPI000B45E900|nr:geminin-like isoform X1 [Mizuhopecten yessoensis]
MASKVGQKHQENIQMAAFRGKNSSEDGLTRLAPSDGRKTLQTLQYSAVKDRKSLGKDALLNAQKEKSGKDTIQIYADPKTPDIKSKTFDDKAVQTEKKSKSEEDIDQEAYDLMVNEDIPENYWRDLAERRREALNESLNENEQLHNEVDELRNENEKLTNMASQAEYFAGVIQELVGVSEESEDKSDDQEEEEEQDSCDKDKESENNDTKDTKPDEKSTPEDIDASEDHKDECQSNTEEETS